MNKETLVDLGEKVLMNTYSRGDKVMVEGKGTYIKDITGNKYLDFISGIATNVLGHADPGLTKTLEEQSSKLVHLSNLFWNEPSIQLAEKLVNSSQLDKVFFANSGAEANEGAIKLARKWGRETKNSDSVEIITMNESFHGRTMATLTATGQPVMHEDFAPYLPGFSYVPLNDSQELKDAVNGKTCAIMIETLQGEGGVNPISQEYIQTIKEIQEEQNVLLIIDEIQTGMGRTGELFSYQSCELKPDIITLAKGLGGGFPIGAVLAVNTVAEHFGPGDHGTTFGGNPLAATAGNYILDTIETDNLLNNVNERNKQLTDGLETLKNNCNIIEEIKGKGLLIGLKLNVPVKKVVDQSYEEHLLIASSKDNVLRILPPLNVSEEEIDQGLNLLEKVFEKL